jgi:cytochrome c-type biogenesis protein CcmH
LSEFIAICAVFVAAAVGVVAWPLLRRSDDGERAPRAGVAAAVVAAALPVAAFLIYFLLSEWDWRAPEEAQSVAQPELQRVVAEIQQRLEEQPDDVEGWKLLGRSATVLGDYPLARRAFGEAYARTQGGDADAVVGYAESMILLDEREIDGEAAQLFERALEMAPDNARALWYGGIVAYRRGDMALAQQRWIELQEHPLPADLRQVLAERLAELEQSQGKPASGAGTAAPASAIELTIDIDPVLAARVPADATLFVIARRGGSGPPLAVQRRPVGAWPVSLRLSDSDAMLPGISLAGAGPLKLVARISTSGQPIAASGDLFGEVGYDFASARPASITIDQTVP